MDKQKKEEYLSIAYLRTIAAEAGVLFSIDPEDSDSVDVHLKKHIDEIDFDATIGIQLKATSSRNNYTEDEEYIHYKLKTKNYNDLRRLASEDKYLALLILPEDENDWIDQKIEELIIRRIMYWVSLKGFPLSNNNSTTTIKIPKIQVLSKDSLLELIKNGLEV